MRPHRRSRDLRAGVPAWLEWLNVAFLRMNTLMGGGVALVEFWDFARVNSLRTLPYLKEWHNRYREAGLRVIGVHTPGYSFGRDRDTVARAVERLEIPFAVRARPRLPGVARVREQGLARPLPVRPPGQVGATALRRGRVRGHRARDRRGARRSTSSRWSRCAPRTSRASCSSRRRRTSRCPRTATGSSWCATGRTARTGSRPPTPARPPTSASARARRTPCSPRAASRSPGSTRWTGRSRRSRPGLRLHGVQFTPAPPARS